MMSLLPSLFVLLALLGFSALFSSLETALFSLSLTEKNRLKSGGGLSVPILKALERPRELLTTVLFGNELVNVAISILAGGIAYELFSEANPRYVYLITVAVTTFILLVFGEIVPKNIAIRNSVIVSQLLILPFRFFAWLIAPFRRILTRFADRIVTLFGADPAKGRMIVEEELKTLLEMGRQKGTLEELEGTLIRNVLDFSTIAVSGIMTRRQQILAIPSTASLQQILDFLYEHRFSRIPVYGKNLDDILGILYAKDLASLRFSDSFSSILPYLKPFALVQPEANLFDLFQEFRARRIHMGIVKGPDQETLGLVTMDDLLRRFFP